MKKMSLLLTALLIINTLYSRRNEPDNKGGGTPTLAAGCAPAVEKSELALNNVRARIEATGGSMWQDRANTIAEYEIPKRLSENDPKFTAIFAGSLWMGGQDVNGQLKIAAVTFRAAGNDFWPGPLDRVTAEIDAPTCSVFDQFFGISRSQVDQFISWYQAGIDDGINGTTTQLDDFPGYQIPGEILEWPAKGNTVESGDGSLTYIVEEDLAPFFDRDLDGFYDPGSGDYPKYDIDGLIDCRTTRDPRLFGDTTIWFVFNDKGNVHNESQGASIGMEIRGQAFAFATNDEVNNMSFYNYEMINRSTFTLTETYFGQWVDADLGNSTDDYVGCDASRGLGYCYNGDLDDENATGVQGYGTTPPAIGVDFFEGPFADDDGIDNPLTQIVQDAIDSNGIPYPGLGIGYGDGIIDNERYGMRKFVYYSLAPQFPGDGDPSSALDYYNYLRGRWRNGGAQMVWGGNGNSASSGGTIPADLLFPGNSDPLFWSTQGLNASPTDWSEHGENNPSGDRRFLESAGPFTLEPGAVNDLTVGIVFAQATSGSNLASIEKLKVADDKAQALFDNCFKIVEGPDAPDVTFQEMDRELILYLSNRKISNNFNETYNLKNPFIAIADTLDGIYQGTSDDKDTLRFYKFQGYQVFQVKNGLVTVGDIRNPNLSRPAFQVDIKDGVTQLVNYTLDASLGANVAEEMVDGEDKGIKHSFRITNDLFATGDPRLINHKTYYYISVAYGYNEFKRYNPLDPNALDGQTLPYIGSRKMAGGQGIRSFSAIPHNPSPENGGTATNSVYGDMPQITRLEGTGNGGNDLELIASSEASIVANNFMDFPTYQSGHGPIEVKVVDPLMVQAGVYKVQFQDTITAGSLTDAYWMLHLPNGDTIFSDQTIEIENEQLFLDEGLSITVKQSKAAGDDKDLGSGIIASRVVYGDSTKRWLGGFSDLEGQNDGNWIRSGDGQFGAGNPYVADPYDDYIIEDPEQDFENLVNGTWSPYGLVSFLKAQPVIATGPEMQDAVGLALLSGAAVKRSELEDIPSVNIVFTSDKSKWSRSMVLEAQPNTALTQPDQNHLHLQLRGSNSVDKNGNDDGTGTGMGWFPGYAINVETGERLNIAFAEDSWLAGENGRDMLWNPTSNARGGINGELLMGGKHYVYVFRKATATPSLLLPAYDESSVLQNIMSTGPDVDKMLAFGTCVWAGIPMLNPGSTLLETTATVKLRVERPFKSFATASSINNGLPYYQFDMTGFEVELGNAAAMDSALALINVVPNPYYAYSEYEVDQLDNRIKLTNLPGICTISIYNVNGTLIRRFQKDDETTSLDWDLKNHVAVPVASGVYLMHILVPDVGERTLKWYGIIKPTDLNGF